MGLTAKVSIWHWHVTGTRVTGTLQSHHDSDVPGRRLREAGKSFSETRPGRPARVTVTGSLGRRPGATQAGHILSARSFGLRTGVDSESAQANLAPGTAGTGRDRDWLARSARAAPITVTGS
jgi:hypothetical protein